MSCSNGKSKTEDVDAEVVWEVSCLWQIYADKSRPPKKKDGGEKYLFREFDKRCFEGGGMLPYLSKTVNRSEKSPPEVQEKNSAEYPAYGSWWGRTWHCFAPLLAAGECSPAPSEKGAVPRRLFQTLPSSHGVIFPLGFRFWSFKWILYLFL